MVAGMGILQTIRRWRSVEVFDTITSLAERFGLDKAETWLFLKFGAATVFGVGGWWTQGLFVGLGLALAVYVMLWVAQREQARAAPTLPDRLFTAPLGPTPNATLHVDNKPPRSLEERVAALEGMKDAVDCARTELSRLDGKIVDVEGITNDRIKEARELFGRLFNELRTRQDAIWRAVQAREAELKLRSLNDEAAGLAKRLLRADAGDYRTDGTPADFAAAWVQEYAGWRECLNRFWHLAEEWERPFPNLFNPPASAFDNIERKPPEKLPRDLEHRWKIVAVVGYRHRAAAEEAIDALQRVARGERVNPA